MNEFDVFKLYNDGICLLILDKDNCEEVDDFEFDKYIIGLFQKGYSLTGKGNLFTDVIETNIRLNIQRQSKELDDIPYLIELFRRF